RRARDREGGRSAASPERVTSPARGEVAASRERIEPPPPGAPLPADAAASATALARWGWPIAVALATAIAYLPTLRNGFVDFDDQTNLLENPFFRALDPAALRWMFTNLDGHYLPLTWLSFAFD